MTAAVPLWLETSNRYNPDAGAWGVARRARGAPSVYVGFFAWYRGLALAGIAHGGEVRQLRALLTLGWSALLLGERITASTVLTALAVIVAVVWSQRGRTQVTAVPQE